MPADNHAFFQAIFANWELFVLLVGLIAGQVEARLKVRRLIALHNPAEMLAEAEDRGKVRADFVTAQQDIDRLAREHDRLDEKVSGHVKDLHERINDVSKTNGGDD